MESILKIKNWREEVFNVEKASPKLYGCFTTMWNTISVHQDDKQMNWLKYLDNEAEWNVESMETKYNRIYVPTFHKAAEKLTLLKHLVISSSDLIDVNETDIVTYSNVLSTLMNTPFEMDGVKKDWELEARVDNENKIYLVHSPKRDVTNSMPRGIRLSRCAPHPAPDYNSLLDTHCEKLKQYLFVKWPVDYYRNVISNLDRKFYETYRINVGEHKLSYAAELSGINSYEKISNLNELKSAEHIMCDTFYAGDLTCETVNYNPLWWSKAYLINANQCLIGICDKTNDRMTEIMQFNTDKFTNTLRYENLWTPKASWKFLDTFFTFVKDEIDRVTTSDREQFVWKFKIIDNETPHITCQPKLVDVNSGNETLADVVHFM